MVSIEVMRSLDRTMVRASGNRLDGFLLEPFHTRTDGDQRLLRLRSADKLCGRGIENPQWWQTRRWRKR